MDDWQKKDQADYQAMTKTPFPETGGRIAKTICVIFAMFCGVILINAIFSGSLWKTNQRLTTTYYSDCSEARDAGDSSIQEGEPAYRPELDADDDGIACEPYNP